jgi:hypothetical protein
MLFVSGIDDNCFAVDNRAKSAELVKGKKFFSQRSDIKHGNYWNDTYEIYAFFRHVLYGENSLTVINGVDVKNGVATLQTQNALFHTVNFLYTFSDDEDGHQWEWRTQPILMEDGKYSVELPVGVTAYAFEVIGDIVAKDHDGDFRQTTKIYINR